MKRVISLSLIMLLTAVTPLFAAQIEGELVSIDPLNKSLRISRTNEKGAPEIIEIEVPDGSKYKGSLPNVAAMPVGTVVSIKAGIGEKPGSWVSSEIREVSLPKKQESERPKSTVSEERKKEVLEEIKKRKELRNKDASKKAKPKN